MPELRQLLSFADAAAQLCRGCDSQHAAAPFIFRRLPLNRLATFAADFAIQPISRRLLNAGTFAASQPRHIFAAFAEPLSTQALLPAVIADAGEGLRSTLPAGHCRYYRR